MLNVHADFRSRSEEVAVYFRLIRELDESRVAFAPPPPGTDPILPSERQILLKTMKASGFLLLYNLVESTLKNAIEAIFDELKGRGVAFDSCREELRRIVLGNLKKHNVDKILPSLASISVDIVVATFKKEELFGGNVDARRVRSVAKEYGFQPPRRKSDELVTVKTNRNDLAHGVKSFSDVGRGYDVSRLEDIRAEVVEFLEELLINIGDYISRAAYLSRP